MYLEKYQQLPVGISIVTELNYITYNYHLTQVYVQCIIAKYWQWRNSQEIQASHGVASFVCTCVCTHTHTKLIVVT